MTEERTRRGLSGEGTEGMWPRDQSNSRVRGSQRGGKQAGRVCTFFTTRHTSNGWLGCFHRFNNQPSEDLALTSLCTDDWWADGPYGNSSHQNPFLPLGRGDTWNGSSHDESRHGVKSAIRWQREEKNKRCNKSREKQIELITSSGAHFGMLRTRLLITTPWASYGTNVEEEVRWGGLRASTASQTRGGRMNSARPVFVHTGVLRGTRSWGGGGISVFFLTNKVSCFRRLPTWQISSKAHF